MNDRSTAAEDTLHRALYLVSFKRHNLLCRTLESKRANGFNVTSSVRLPPINCVKIYLRSSKSYKVNHHSSVTAKASGTNNGGAIVLRRNVDGGLEISNVFLQYMAYLYS